MITCSPGLPEHLRPSDERAEVRHVFTVEVPYQHLCARRARAAASAAGRPRRDGAAAGISPPDPGVIPSASADDVSDEAQITHDGWVPVARVELKAYADARRPVRPDGQAVAWDEWLADTTELETAIPAALAALLAASTSTDRQPRDSAASDPGGAGAAAAAAGVAADGSGAALLAGSVVLWVCTLEVHPAMRHAGLGRRLLAHATAALRTGLGDLAILEAAVVPTRFDPRADSAPPSSRAALSERREQGIRALTGYYTRAGYVAVPDRYTGGRGATHPQVLVRPLGSDAVRWCTTLGLGPGLSLDPRSTGDV